MTERAAWRRSPRWARRWGATLAAGHPSLSAASLRRATLDAAKEPPKSPRHAFCRAVLGQPSPSVNPPTQHIPLSTPSSQVESEIPSEVSIATSVEFAELMPQREALIALRAQLQTRREEARAMLEEAHKSERMQRKRHAM